MDSYLPVKEHERVALIKLIERSKDPDLLLMLPRLRARAERDAADREIIEKARRIYESESIDIDDDTIVVQAAAVGVYVMAWVWVRAGDEHENRHRFREFRSVGRTAWPCIYEFESIGRDGALEATSCIWFCSSTCRANYKCSCGEDLPDDFADGYDPDPVPGEMCTYCGTPLRS